MRRAPACLLLEQTTLPIKASGPGVHVLWPACTAVDKHTRSATCCRHEVRVSCPSFPQCDPEGKLWRGRLRSACWMRAGLTKVPIDGQPRSIVQELDDMARVYIKVGSRATLVTKAPTRTPVCRSPLHVFVQESRHVEPR